MKPHKLLIERRFEKAVSSYEEEAFVQKEIALRLSKLMESHVTIPYRILEIGCGTGFLTRHCMSNYPNAIFTLNDLCDNLQPLLKKRLPKAFQFIQGDAEKCTFPAEQDLIVSCSTIQWFQQVDLFFKRCHSILSSQGLLAFSTFGEKNFIEIKEITGQSLCYPSLHRLTEWLQEDFEILAAEETIRQTAYTDPLDVLKHLKRTGVNSLSSTTWSMGKLQKFIQDYRDNHTLTSGEVSLTYHPIFIIARKKEQS